MNFDRQIESHFRSQNIPSDKITEIFSQIQQPVVNIFPGKCFLRLVSICSLFGKLNLVPHSLKAVQNYNIYAITIKILKVWMA